MGKRVIYTPPPDLNLYRHQECQEVTEPILLIDKWGHQYLKGFFPDGEVFHRIRIENFSDVIEECNDFEAIWELL